MTTPVPHSHVAAGDRPFRVLVIEDESLGGAIRTVLENAGYIAEWRLQGRDAAAFAAGWCPDVILLDLWLPDMKTGLGGIRVCRQLREWSRTTAIIVVTHIRHDHVVIQALEAGADDYLVKPFHMDVLLAYIHRKTESIKAAEERRKSPGNVDSTLRLLTVGEHVVIDHNLHEIRIDGEQVHLTKTEFRLLDYLAQNQGRLVPYSMLYKHACERDFVPGPDTRTLQVHMTNLRAKLSRGGSSCPYIRNELGVGYELRESIFNGAHPK